MILSQNCLLSIQVAYESTVLCDCEQEKHLFGRQERIKCPSLTNFRKGPGKSPQTGLTDQRPSLYLEERVPSSSMLLSEAFH